jgi:hypothetical protein
MRQVFHAPSGARGIDPAPARMTGTDAANPETPTAPLLFEPVIVQVCIGGSSLHWRCSLAADQATLRAAREGLASLMRPMRPLSMNRSYLASPLRCDPNGYRSDDRGTKPRWCHAILRAIVSRLATRTATLTLVRREKCQVVFFH